MAKRFSDTQIWDEDWFLDMPIGYKLFWFYILSSCDQAGFWKVNLRSFGLKCGFDVDVKTALSYYNSGKKRIRTLSEGMWLVEDFFKFQYGHKFNKENKIHLGIEKIYNRYGVSIESLKGIERVSKGY